MRSSLFVFTRILALIRFISSDDTYMLCNISRARTTTSACLSYHGHSIYSTCHRPWNQTQQQDLPIHRPQRLYVYSTTLLAPIHHRIAHVRSSTASRWTGSDHGFDQDELSFVRFSSIFSHAKYASSRRGSGHSTVAGQLKVTSRSLRRRLCTLKDTSPDDDDDDLRTFICIFALLCDICFTVTPTVVLAMTPLLRPL